MDQGTGKNAKELLEEQVLIWCMHPMNVPKNKKSAEHDVFSFETSFGSWNTKEFLQRTHPTSGNSQRTKENFGA